MKPRFKQGDRVWVAPIGDDGEPATTEVYGVIRAIEDDDLVIVAETKYRPAGNPSGIMTVSRDGAVLVPSKESPADLVRKWGTVIGIGFHPDTPGRDYDPPLPDPDLYDRDMDRAFAALGDEVYRIALETIQA
jgi:hypothetical protein